MSSESTISNQQSTRVSLLGAGPGCPGLLTLRAVECLRQADLVLYDQGVPEEMLLHAPESARKVCIDDDGWNPERRSVLHQTMIDAALQGLRVVRLEGGDPLQFGHGAEEAQALRQAGVPFEIVPGVTAALGATAYAGIPLTHPLHASAVVLVDGHEQQGMLDEEGFARFPGTLVFYNAVSRIEQIVRSLLEHGKPADTPAAAIFRGSTAGQRTVQGTLSELPGVMRQKNIREPALVVIGEVVHLRDELAWFESRPLFGKRVVVTRPRHQAGDMAGRVENLGGQAIVLPTIEITEPADWSPVDRALEQLTAYHWLVFTSSNGVHAFIKRLRHTGRDLRALGGLRLAVIGPATGNALRSYHLEPDVMPEEFNSEGLAARLCDRVAKQRVLLARADRGIDLLREELSRVARVDQVAVYSQHDSVLTAEATALQMLGRGEIDYVTLTSSNIALSLIRALDEQAREHIQAGRTGLVSISPRTSAAVREQGLPVAIEAKVYTTEGVLAALCELAQQS